jgi:hypothetical protein
MTIDILRQWGALASALALEEFLGEPFNWVAIVA